MLADNIHYYFWTKSSYINPYRFLNAAEINPMNFAENPWHQSLAGPPAGAGGAPSTDFLCSATSPPAAEYDCVRRSGGSPGWAPAFDLHGQDGNIHSGLLSNSQLDGRNWASREIDDWDPVGLLFALDDSNPLGPLGAIDDWDLVALLGELDDGDPVDPLGEHDWDPVGLLDELDD